MPKDILETLNERMPALVDISDEVYEALFGKINFVPNSLIATSDDYQCGAICNELEYLRGYINRMSASTNIDNMEGTLLDTIVDFFTHLVRIWDETDANLLNRFHALIRRKANPRWMTTWSMMDAFSYFFDKASIYLIENYIETDLSANGDFEQGSGDTFTSWNKTEAGSSVIVNIVDAWWLQLTSPFGSSSIRAVIYNESASWVAVGLEGKIGTSEDGITWVLITNPSGSVQLEDIAYNGTSLWVIAGLTQTVMSSPDSITWTKRNVAGGVNFFSIAHNQDSGVDGLWVLTGSSGKVFTSPNAIDWTSRSNPFGTSGIEGVAYNGVDLWVIVGFGGKLSTSPDGITWSALKTTPTADSLYEVAHNHLTGGSALWVAVGYNGLIITSSDGNTWTQRTSSFGTSIITSVAYDSIADEWIAVGDDGKMASSLDGISWAQLESPFGTSDVFGIAIGINRSIAVGQAGKIADARRKLGFSGSRAPEFQIDSSNSNASLDQTISSVAAGDYKIAFFYEDNGLCPDDNLIYLTVQRSGDSYYYNFTANQWQAGAAGKYFEAQGGGYKYGSVYLSNADTRDLTFTLVNAGASGTAYKFRIDLFKFGIWKDYPSFKLLIKVDIQPGPGDLALWNGSTEDNLMDRGECESTTSPMIMEETVPYEPTPGNQSWSRDATAPYMGSYNRRLNKDVASGAGDAETFLTDNKNTDDMHGLIAGTKYTLAFIGKPDEITNVHIVIIHEYYSGGWYETAILTDTAGSWKRYSQTITLNAGTTGFAISIFIGSNAALNSTFDIDNIRLIKGADSDIEKAGFLDNDFILGAGGGYTSSLYDDILDIIKPEGVKAVLSIVST